MAKLTQVLRNSTDRPLFINLEASTSRYRLAPGEVLLLHYDPEEKFQEYTAPVVIECIDHRGEVELVMWTAEFELFHPDGRKAETCYD